METKPASRCRMRHSILLSTILVVLVSLFLPYAVHAGSISVQKSEAMANFPYYINFVFEAESTAVIDKVTLIYGLTTASCFDSQARHEMEFDPAESVKLKWEWDLFRSGDLPPGVEIWWQWEIHAKDDSSLTTEVQKLRIEDASFDWKMLKSGSISLYWASGSASFGQTLLNIAVSGAERLSKHTGLSTSGEIQIYIYPSAEDMKGVLAHTTEWMGGVAFPEHKIILLGISPAQIDWARESIPHELAHLEMEMRTFNCVNQDVPSWLNEGMARFAEGPVSENNRTAVVQALEKNNLQSLSSIAEGFPADSNRAYQAYNQSHQVVTFLIEEYGQEKLQALLDLLQNGENIDPALRSVYGLDTTGIDQTWRASLGFGTAPQQSFATATPLVKDTAVPTLALMQIAGLATETPTAAPSPTVTSAPTLVETSTPAPTAVTNETAADITPVVDGAGISAAPNILLWLFAGGAAVIVLALLVILFVIPRTTQKK